MILAQPKKKGANLSVAPLELRIERLHTMRTYRDRLPDSTQ